MGVGEISTPAVTHNHSRGRSHCMCSSALFCQARDRVSAVSETLHGDHRLPPCQGLWGSMCLHILHSGCWQSQSCVVAGLRFWCSCCCQPYSELPEASTFLILSPPSSICKVSSSVLLSSRCQSLWLPSGLIFPDFLAHRIQDSNQRNFPAFKAQVISLGPGEFQLCPHLPSVTWITPAHPLQPSRD